MLRLLRQAIQVLVEKGNSAVDGANKTGLTALHRAAIWGNATAAAKLLELGASLTARTNEGCRFGCEAPAETAARYGQTSVAEAIAGAEAARKAQKERAS